jgi:hypothetical protein
LKNPVSGAELPPQLGVFSMAEFRVEPSNLLNRQFPDNETSGASDASLAVSSFRTIKPGAASPLTFGRQLQNLAPRTLNIYSFLLTILHPLRRPEADKVQSSEYQVDSMATVRMSHLASATHPPDGCLLTRGLQLHLLDFAAAKRAFSGERTFSPSSLKAGSRSSFS